jgi:DHA1 family multidrug resistance protein-like MFS transporter
MAIVASVAPQKRMGWSLGMMQAGTMAGSIFGPLLGGVLSTLFGMRTSFIVSSLIIFVAAMAVVLWVKEEKQERANVASRIADDLKTAFYNRPLLLMLGLMLVLQCSINMIQPLLSLHIVNLHGKMEGVVLSSGIILSLIGLAGIIASPFWGRAGERFGYQRILTICLLLAGSVAIIQNSVYQLWLFVMVQCLFGLFVAGIPASASTIIVQSSALNFQGRAFGLTTSSNNLGAMFGALLGGIIGSSLNTHWIFLVAGLLLIVLGVFVPSLAKHAKSDSP